MMEMERGKRYVIKTMWLAVEKLSDGKRWEGRTDLKIARKVSTNLFGNPTPPPNENVKRYLPTKIFKKCTDKLLKLGSHQVTRRLAICRRT